MTDRDLTCRGDSALRYALIATAAVWCGAIVVAPLFQLDWIYAFFASICHQMPERSWALSGHPLAACVRCTSIYLGFLTALIMGLPANRRFLITSLVATGTEFLLARTGLDYTVLRAGTGLLLGMSAAGFVAIGIEELFRMRVARRLSIPAPPGARR